MKNKFKYLYKKDNKVKSYIFTLEDIEYLDMIIDDIHFSSFAEFDKYMINEGYRLIARQCYTGKKDMNGVEIYEWDIVKHLYYPFGVNKKARQYYQLGVVQEYAFISWKIDALEVIDKSVKSPPPYRKKEDETYIDMNGLHIFNKNNVYVIGNIYENKDLIK